jgi:hypothetical protein
VTQANHFIMPVIKLRQSLYYDSDQQQQGSVFQFILLSSLLNKTRDTTKAVEHFFSMIMIGHFIQTSAI